MPLVEKLNFKFDVDELRNYVDVLQNNFRDYSWDINDVQKLSPTNYTTERIKFATQCYGWAITTENLDTTSKSNSPWPEAIYNSYQDKELQLERKTDLVFGVIERLFEKIPYACKVIISVFPPGAETIPHNDQDFLLRVHVPIYTHKKVRWLTEQGYYDLHELGSAYLCDTRKMHSVYNDSDVDRIHLIFAIEDKNLEKIKRIKGTI
jgi:hypothetical protein